MTNRSSFPNEIDVFEELFDLPPQMISSANRLQELKAKADLNALEIDELNALVVALSPYTISPEHWNKFADALVNVQTFFTEDVTEFLNQKKEEYEAYITEFRYAGVFYSNRTYHANNIVKNDGDLYIALQDIPLGSSLSNTNLWSLVNSYTVEQDLARYNYTLTATSNNQTVFTIPLETFDYEKDYLLVVQNGVLLADNKYTLNGKRITLNTGVAGGTEIYLSIIKRIVTSATIPTTVTGSVLADGSVPLEKLTADVVTKAEYDADFLGTNLETVELNHGLNIVENTTDTNTIADVKIEGNTLVSLGNTPIENGKKYVLADPKTTLKYGTDTMEGVSKLDRNLGDNEYTTISNFAGKVTGNTATCPHYIRHSAKTGAELDFTTIVPPGSPLMNEVGTSYCFLSPLDGGHLTISNDEDGNIAQCIFSFNVIEQIERNIGHIPRKTLSEKVQWAKDNIRRITFDWYGFGRSPNGNKANLVAWTKENVRLWLISHSSNSVQKLSSPFLSWRDAGAISDYLTDEGFVHYGVYSEASDGVTASIIHTDYAEVKIELRKQVDMLSDFANKVSGSLVQNSNICRYSTTSDDAEVPTSNNLVEIGDYSNILTHDGLTYTTSTNTSGTIAQQVFSFNLVDIINKNIGIPRSSLADKIQWIKDNLRYCSFNWKGTVSSVDNIIKLAYYSPDGYVSSWGTSTGQSLGNGGGFSGSYNLGDDGYMHYYIFTSASDGTTPSVINTDYVKLEIGNKKGEQLSFTPQVIRKANFEGKVSGSTVECPHIAKRTNNNNDANVWNSLASPSHGSIVEFNEEQYEKIKNSDGSSISVTNIGNTNIPQCVFSFNIIEEIEKNVGKIPASDLASKVSWARENTENITCNWYGYGSCPSGNKAYLDFWNGSTWSASHATHTDNTISGLGRNINESIPASLTDDGFIHFLAYTDASDGTTPSIIYTDYVELEITLKRNANNHNPVIPVYEVTSDEYNKVLVDWNSDEVQARYPKVKGMQHVVNPYIKAEGENLLNLESLSVYGINSTSYTFDGEIYSIEGKTGPLYSGLYINNFMPSTFAGQTITFSFDAKSDLNRMPFVYGVSPIHTTLSNEWQRFTHTFTFEPSSYNSFTFYCASSPSQTTFYIKNMMVNLGSEAKPFVPYNPSYLATSDIKLGKIGDYKDTLYYEDGDWKIRKVIEKDFELDGNSFDWRYNNWSTVGDIKADRNKIFYCVLPNTLPPISPSNVRCITSSGELLVPTYSIGQMDYISRFYTNTSYNINIVVSNKETGFATSYPPANAEVKAFFNGWKVKTANASTNKPESWQSVVDGTDAPTQTLAYVSANRATGYVPYKLSYVLETPITETVTDKVEGSVALNEKTQIEVNSGIVKEVIVPYYDSINRTYQFNYPSDYQQGQMLSFPTNNIVAIYKDGAIENKAIIRYDITGSYGGSKAHLATSDYDSTATYTVIYEPLNKKDVSINNYGTSLTYAQGIRDSHNSLVTKVSDIESTVSVNSRLLVDILARLRAGGL